MLLVGDLMIGGSYIDYCRQRKQHLLSAFESTMEDFSNCDILVSNLEAPIYSGTTKRQDVTSHLSNDQSVVSLLRKPPLSMCNLANNHMMDYGVSGLSKTLEILKDNGIHSFGAGLNEKKALKESVIECKNVRIACIGLTTNEKNVNAVLADSSNPGCSSFLEKDTVVNKISQLKSRCDFVLVSIHWGHEYFRYPSNEQVILGHDLIDAGASVVIGHHPHLIQGFEKYKTGHIFYSLGNFFLPPVCASSGRFQPRKAGAGRFLMVRLEITAGRVESTQLIGGALNRAFRLQKFSEMDNDRLIRKLTRISEPLMNSDYSSFWEQYRRIQKKRIILGDLLNVFRKLFSNSPIFLINSLSFSDIKRNLRRIASLIR